MERYQKWLNVVLCVTMRLMLLLLSHVKHACGASVEKELWKSNFVAQLH